MLPSLVAAELQGRIREFLRTTFPATTPGFLRPDGRTMLDDFLAQPDMLFKGPYLSLGLPFRTAPEDATLPFERITPGFRPYRHQLTAFRRLCGAAPQATLVATGTGSGKTECFLYPILDHCATATGLGIKAIVIYPMNALATDQARRFAREIYNRKELRGKVRVGLFVGDKDKSEHTKMTEDFVITCKETPSWPARAGRCRTTCSRNSRTICDAAVWSTASCGYVATPATPSICWRSAANTVGSARAAALGVWPRAPRCWSTRSSPSSRCASGC